MAITNYTELTGAVVAWLEVPTADVSSVISDLVMVGEKRIMREVRTPDMEDTHSTAISSGVIAVPTGFVELKYAYIDRNPSQRIEMVSPNVIYDRSHESGRGARCSRPDGSNFIFGPYPDSTYTVNLRFYKHLTAVQTTINALFTENPDLYLWACLSEASPILKQDDRIAVWESKYQMVKELVNGEAGRSHFSGPMTIRPG
jgi:hypothetical protein